MSIEVDTPEIDKMRAIHDKSQAIGEFLEWLADQGVRRMRYGPVSDRRLCPRSNCDNGKIRWRSRDHYDDNVKLRAGDDCPKCEGTGFVEVEVEAWMPDGRSIETLLAEFFDIDLAKVEQEKRAILDALREANA